MSPSLGSSSKQIIEDRKQSFLSKDVREELNLTQATIKVKGNNRSNYIVGEVNGSKMYGKGGNDFLASGPSKNWLSGGNGADVFSYSAVRQSKRGPKRRDIILDFNPAEGDLIDFSQVNLGNWKNDIKKFSFIGSEKFSGEKPQIRFDKGMLQVNTNKDLKPEMEVKVKGINKFNSDFLLDNQLLQSKIVQSDRRNSPGVVTTAGYPLIVGDDKGNPTDSVIMATVFLKPDVKGAFKGLDHWYQYVDPSYWEGYLQTSLDYKVKYDVLTGNNPGNYTIQPWNVDPISVGGGAPFTLSMSAGMSVGGDLSYTEASKNSKFTVETGQHLGAKMSFGPDSKTSFESTSSSPKGSKTTTPKSGLKFHTKVTPNASINGGIGAEYKGSLCDVGLLLAEVSGSYNVENEVIFNPAEQKSKFSNYLSAKVNAFGVHGCGVSINAITDEIGRLNLGSGEIPLSLTN